MTWFSLDSVPKDGSTVLFWDEDGEVVTGNYDAVLDYYTDRNGIEILPIAWRECPRPPASAAEIVFKRRGDEA